MSAVAFSGQREVRFLCWATVIVTLYGLGAAHLPFLLQHPWTTCAVANELGCVLTFHVLEVPMVLFQLFFAWYGFTRLRVETVGTFRTLLTGSNVLNAVFALFEASLLLETVKGGGPTWEALALASLLLAFQIGTFFGIYVLTKLPR